tara:strand:+ start:304 stop:519 length:216 start_codon:yes stop_codon:yes gene_type:complete
MYISVKEGDINKNIHITDVEIINTNNMILNNDDDSDYSTNNNTLLNKLFEKIISYIDLLCVGESCINKVCP